MATTLVHSFRLPSGEARLGMLVKRAYRIEPARRATPLAEPPPLYLTPALSGDEGPLLHDADAFSFQKPLTDVLVQGSAHSLRGPVANLDTGVQVERAQKRVRVVGERRVIARGDRRLSMSAPVPFTSMKLGWERAYGGRDLHAEQKLLGAPAPALAGGRVERPVGAFSYPRNPFGRSFYGDVDRDRVIGEELPNLEDAEDPLSPERLFAKSDLDWIDRPVAAGFGPISVYTFPRCMFFLLRPDWAPATRPIRELALGALLTSDLADRPVLAPPDPRLFNSAAAGLAVCRLHGGERASLWGLHPRHELLDFELPGEKPRLVLEPPNAGARELDATLQTVLIEPDEDRLTLTWTGTLPVAGVFPGEMCRAMRSAVTWMR